MGDMIGNIDDDSDDSYYSWYMDDNCYSSYNDDNCYS